MSRLPTLCGLRFVSIKTLIAVWTAFVCAVPLAADDATETFFRELRRRRLFSLAEGHCLDRLNQPALTANKRLLFTRELARTFLEHARYTTGEEQSDLWQRAVDTIEDFLRDNAEHPQRLLLEIDRASIPASQGEMLRWQAELFPENAALRQRALDALADAVARLKPLADRLDEQPQWRELADEVWYLLATAHLDLARVSPAGSPDRTAALNTARGLFRELSNGAALEVRTWHSRVALAACDRLEGKLDEADGRLTAILPHSPPAEALDSAVAERARVLLDANRPDQAAQTLLDYRKLRQPEPGELRFVNIGALIRLWEIADGRKDTLAAEGLLGQIDSRVQQAEQEIGGYWGQRCRLLREQFEETRRYGAELIPLVRQARASYVERGIDEAIEQYGQAALSAHRAGKIDAAAELAHLRASIQLEAERYAEAADSFRELADRFPQQPRAAEAHLLAAYCLGKLFDADRNDSNRAAYAAALQQHREQFRDGPTTGEASWMLARLEESTGRVVEALKLYQSVPAEHARAGDAHRSAARCYERILELLHEAGRDASAWRQDAVRWLEDAVAAFPPPQQRWSVEQAEIVLRLARILLGGQSPNLRRADQLLGRVVLEGQYALSANSKSVSETTAEAWKSLLKTALQLRIIALAGHSEDGGKQAAELLRELAQAPPGDILAVLDGLTRLSVGGDESAVYNLGQLQLQAAVALDQRRSELNAAEERKLDRCLAEAYVATRQPRRASELYETLARQSPRDKRLRRMASELLMQLDNSESLQRARTSWQKLEALEVPGGDGWLDARYHTILCSFRLNDFDHARKLLEVTRLLYPTLGGPELRTRFEQLQRQLDRAAK